MTRTPRSRTAAWKRLVSPVKYLVICHGMKARLTGGYPRA